MRRPPRRRRGASRSVEAVSPRRAARLGCHHGDCRAHEEASVIGRATRKGEFGTLFFDHLSKSVIAERVVSTYGGFRGGSAKRHRHTSNCAAPPLRGGCASLRSGLGPLRDADPDVASRFRTCRSLGASGGAAEVRRGLYLIAEFHRPASHHPWKHPSKASRGSF